MKQITTLDFERSDFVLFSMSLENPNDLGDKNQVILLNIRQGFGSVPVSHGEIRFIEDFDLNPGIIIKRGDYVKITVKTILNTDNYSEKIAFHGIIYDAKLIKDKSGERRINLML
jgi:hypothetical protein